VGSALDDFPPILGTLLPPRFPGRNRLRPYPERKPRNVLFLLGKTGAGEGIRTLDPNLGKTAIAPAPLLAFTMKFPRLIELHQSHSWGSGADVITCFTRFLGISN